MRTRCSPSSRPDARRWATVEVGSLGSARGSLRVGVRHQTSASPRRVERRRRRRRWRAGTRISPARRYAPRPSPRWGSARIRRWCTRDGARRLERGKDPSRRRRRRRRLLGAFGTPGTTRVVRLSSDRPSLWASLPPASIRRHRRRRWSRVHATSPPHTSRSSSRQVRMVPTCLRCLWCLRLRA